MPEDEEVSDDESKPVEIVFLGQRTLVFDDVFSGMDACLENDFA
ncbi:MAG: hypothetical protein ACQKBW_04510 [Puniceicoccales bacterium]